MCKSFFFLYFWKDNFAAPEFFCLFFLRLIEAKFILMKRTSFFSWYLFSSFHFTKIDCKRKKSFSYYKSNPFFIIFHYYFSFHLCLLYFRLEFFPLSFSFFLFYFYFQINRKCEQSKRVSEKELMLQYAPMFNVEKAISWVWALCRYNDGMSFQMFNIDNGPWIEMEADEWEFDPCLFLLLKNTLCWKVMEQKLHIKKKQKAVSKHEVRDCSICKAWCLGDL